MAYEFKLPDLGEGLTEGEIARWLVSEGQEIAEDDPLVEIQTDKTTVEIPSPAAGTVTSILVEEGKVVPVGTVLVVIGGDPDGERRAAAPGALAKARVTPLVRKIAQELGVDLDSLTGTGPQGRITEEDVRGKAGPSEGRREPLRGVRRVIAEHMARAHREVPAVTWVEECDFSGMDLKQLVPAVLKACAETLKEFPELNARLERDEIVFLDRYDLGVAVQTDDGLVVPVGTVLVVIGGDSGDGAPSVEAERPAVSQPAPAAKGRATPLVRKIAQELGVDLDSLAGTGPHGRVTAEDVRGAA